MFSFKSIVLIAAAFAIGAECSEVAVPLAAPLTVPAHVGYAHTIPQNIAPYASQVSVVNRAVAAPLAAPIAAPIAAPFAGPYAAPFAARVAAPYYAGFPAAAPYAFPAPAAYAGPGAYAAPAAYAAPYPYAAPVAPLAGPFLRTPFGVTPAFVR